MDFVCKPDKDDHNEPFCVSVHGHLGSICAQTQNRTVPMGVVNEILQKLTNVPHSVISHFGSLLQ